MTYEEYVGRLKLHGYRIKENLTFLDTPWGVWIQEIIEDLNGFGLRSVLNPAEFRDREPMFKLTEKGKLNARNYIRELNAKRKEILDAGKDTINDTNLPTEEDIENDVNFIGIDSDGEYYNGWAVTDNYDADNPLLLKLGRDLEAV